MFKTPGGLWDLELENSYGALPDHFYHQVHPAGLKKAHLISFNPPVAQLLGVDPCRIKPSELARCFGAGELLPGTSPLAMKYAGHQFGVYNPELGDGRGVLLGEVVNQAGERWDLHLKGAGKTRYSRFGDGRAVLRSSIREYLISEAMYGLGIPTTRALCLVGSEEYTLREGMEPCAMLTRVSQCHIRFGHFEHFFYSRQHEALKTLADYCLARFFPDLAQAAQPYLAMFERIRDLSVQLVASWQAYGFVHGVMNTDNMSILGETFDYGPFAFMDSYNPDFVSSHTDYEGRYAFKKQPSVMQWNLAALAQALLPLIPRDALEAALDAFAPLYESAFTRQMRRRLGLFRVQPEDDQLIAELLVLLTKNRLDMQRFLRDLADFGPAARYPEGSYLSTLVQVSSVTRWLGCLAQRLEAEADGLPDWQARMAQSNPCYVLRTYMAEEVIREAHQGDYRGVNQLLNLLREPFVLNSHYQRYAGEPPDWAGGLGLSCSS